MSTIVKKCKQCDRIFETDTKQRMYCGNECYYEQRMQYHKKYSVDYYRKKRGTLKRWANELIKSGYTVIEPKGIPQ